MDLPTAIFSTVIDKSITSIDQWKTAQFNLLKLATTAEDRRSIVDACQMIKRRVMATTFLRTWMNKTNFRRQDSQPDMLFKSENLEIDLTLSSPEAKSRTSDSGWSCEDLSSASDYSSVCSDDDLGKPSVWEKYRKNDWTMKNHNFNDRDQSSDFVDELISEDESVSDLSDIEMEEVEELNRMAVDEYFANPSTEDLWELKHYFGHLYAVVVARKEAPVEDSLMHG